ncbi:MAG: global cell cycle regulator GcrA-like protein [Alphaproteobacteria bacterium]|nr:MAG: global cell cycle regulator GcrA-like protein [Alphaproteobacteria bacterium]
MAWTEDNIEKLKKLWEKGLSASQIAEKLGDGISRNAVIGKVHRLGLKSRPSPVKAPRKAAETKTGRAHKPRARKKTEDKRVHLLDLTERMCKWPIGHPGEPDFHFCGKPSQPGLPYCAEHCSEAYQAPARRDRRNPRPR